MVQRGNPAGISDLDDLCGKVVAVEEGTVQVDLVERTQASCPAGTPVDVKLYDTNDDALVELRTGRAAAVLNDYPPAAYLSTAQRTQADYQLASDVQYEPGLYGIAVAPDREQLRDALQGHAGDDGRVGRVREGARGVGRRGRRRAHGVGERGRALGPLSASCPVRQ